MEDSIFDDFFELCKFCILGMYSVMTPCLFCKFDGIDRGSEVSERSRLGPSSDWSGRRCLASRESVVFVIEDYIGDIHIATTGVDEVTHTDTIAITITSDSYDSERGIYHLDPCGEWECATMESLCRIAIDILTCFS